MEPVVIVEDLNKRFYTAVREPGLRAALRQLVRPVKHEVRAVDGLGFEIKRGERVAFIGPNGAGKSTTIKVLSGILYPSSGRVEVMGLVPWEQRRVLGYRIGTVFGQRSQLWYHLPAADTFELLARIYDRDLPTHRRRCDALVAAFEIGDLIHRPVRQLSLGERMRCEIAASLLHDPDVLFLDEPTIGLDVTAKAIIRDLIKEQSSNGRTVLLTSHDTGDMERVCDRVIVIHEGRLLLDEPVAALRRNYIKRKLITLHTSEERVEFELPGVRIAGRSPHTTELEVDVSQTPVECVVQAALSTSRLRDLRVEDPPMDEIVSAIYEQAAGRA
ncbi:MAG: ATP-binding cassette domain-containing protein [bacterium]|nr:ATP-binding cassette domain-containing protein [bacterium]